MKKFLCFAIAAALTIQSLSAAELSVWAAPEGFKIDKFGKKIFVLDAKQDLATIKKKNEIWDAEKSAIAIAGARGETVAFQLGIEGGDAGLKQVNVKPGKFSGPGEIPESAVELFKMYYTQVNDKGSGPTNGPTMGKGWYPNALVPWIVPTTTAYKGYDGPPFPIAATEIQGVWIDISIPYGTKAGAYNTDLVVSSADASKTLKLTLTVRDFDIPRKIHNTFFMNFQVSELNQAGGWWLKGDKLTAYEDDVYRLSRRHRFTAGNMYNDETPKIVETDGELKSVDWTAYDAHYDKVLSMKKNLFGPGEDALEIWKVPLVTAVKSRAGQWPKGEKAWDQMIGEIKKHWADKSWDISRGYVYLADEPPMEATKQLKEYAQRVQKSPGPALRRQIAVYTILGNAWDKQKPIFDLWKDSLDMWMVAGDYYHVEDMNNLPTGALKGQYQGGEPYQGNETLDADGVAMRSWSWIAFLYRIDYQCYYAMDEGWRGLKHGQDKNNCQIWDEPRNRPWGHSQGVFLYPGKRVDYDHPIVNIRMKQIRRGQTDFEYFWLLRQAGEEKLADSLAKGVIHAALSEGGAAPEAYGYGKWSHNPEEWDTAVKSAAAKLEELKDKLPKEPATLEAKP